MPHKSLLVIFAFSARTVALLGCLGLVLLFAGRSADAHETSLRGLILAVLPVRNEVVVRYDGFLAGFPAQATRTAHPSQSATFRVEPGSALRALKPGSEVAATVDLDTKPWTLRGVRATGVRVALSGQSAPVADLSGVLRDVHHVSIGEFVPETRFLDQRGRRFSLRNLRGQTIVMAFIYTRCHDARECPLISAKFLRLQERLHGQPVHLVEVSLDPAYDTSAVLARYGRTFGADPARWSLLTGDPDKVLDFAAQFDVTAFPDQRIGLIHPERTVVIDQYGTIRELIDESSWSPDELIATVDHDRRLAANPFERFNLWLSSAAVAVCGNSVASFSGFTDLLTVIAILAFFTFLFWRVGRAIHRSAT
ncbi:MAG: SCO family protein [Candidatus Eremiobacteraeota bacterium]|nr:SCO family protein [Candidatus Eremiobacteraeota bacterium]